MASNFRIFIHRNDKNIHLKLSGDFDGSSAYELMNLLDSYCSGAEKIFIHTGGLSSIHSFGINIFKTKYSSYKNLIFTGEPGRELTLEGRRYLS